MASPMTRMVAVAVMTLMVVATAIGGVDGQGDGRCANGMRRLNECTSFLVTGNNSAPTSECCSALGGVDRDCLCNTLRLASQLPSRCQLPAFNCPSSGSIGDDE